LRIAASIVAQSITFPDFLQRLEEARRQLSNRNLLKIP